MPIDFAAVAALFRTPLTAETTLMKPVFDRLVDAVKDLDRTSLLAERATRAYPVLRYRDGALAVHVDVAGAPPLARTGSLELAEGLRDGGRRFVEGLGWVRTAVDQELALPRMLDVPLDALRAVAASLDRFSRATPAMFDDRRSRFSDVFGLLNLGWSSLLGRADQDQIRAAAGGAMAGMTLVDIVFSFLPADPPELAALSGLDRLQEKLDEKAKLVLDIVLILPVVGLAIEVLVADGSIYVERLLLTELSGVEQKVYDLRSGVVDGLLMAFEAGSTAHFFVAAAELVLGLDVAVLTTGFPAWLDGLVAGVTDLVQSIGDWGRWITSLLEAVRSVVDDFMNFDLMGWIAGMLLPAWLLSVLPALPRLTVDDLIGMAVGEAVGSVRSALESWFGAADRALSVVPGDTAASYRAKLAAAGEVVDIVLTPTPFTYPPDVMPTGPLAGFPDIYESVFGGGRRALLLDSVRTFGDELRAGVVGTLRGGAALAGGLADMAGAEGERQATFGAGLHLREWERGSRGVAHDLFSPLEGDVRSRMAARRADPMALAFDDAAASVGIAAAGAAVPAYVGEMRRFWAARATPVEHPTSAHILARHGRLAMVRVPRLTLHAEGREPGADLAAQAATGFRGAVGTAYRDGRARLAALASAGGGAG